MIYLFLTIASSTLVSISMRLSEKYIKNNMGMFMANYGVCMVLSRWFMGEASLWSGENGIGLSVGLGILSGILYLVNFVMMQSSMRYNGVTLTSAFMKLGVLVPTLSAILIFHEHPGVFQTAGMLLALLSIFVIYSEKDGGGKSDRKIFLLLLLLVSGVTDSLSNVYDKLGNTDLKDHFLLCIFLAAFLLAFVLAIRKKKTVGKLDVLFGILIGIPNYFSARFLLLALGELPAVAVYPICNVGTIVSISLAGALLFRERMEKKKAATLGIAILALVLLNIG